ncbi:MAG: Ig domain-containing protein [Limisphaerales bacterium]
MFQSFKKISWILLLGIGLQSSWAFSLLGPSAQYPGVPGNGTTFGDDWQTPDISYGGGDSTLDGLPLGVQNIGEAYRHNVPTLYYACDANFLNYFGLSGSDAIDQAFAIINNSMTNNSIGNLNGYSTALTEFPLNSLAVNYQASALNLVDLKSETLQLMMEQLGLADPIRYTWCLHNRFQVPNSTPTCPFNMEYQVVMRNLDIISSPLNQIQYSPYVNASLYTYFIVEVCTPPNPVADAQEYLVDPLVNNPPVASAFASPLPAGSFYTGLTRDDMGGLRYLYDTNLVAREQPDTNSVLLNTTQSGGTNYGLPYVLFTSNYNAFAAIALTNDAATLTNLYPGLIITSSTYSFVALNIPIIALTTNSLIGAPAGTQVLGIKTNGYTQTYEIHYKHTYANLIVPAGFASTNKNTTGYILTTQVYPLSGAPAGTLGTNYSIFPYVLSGVPSGDYYISTNPCGPDLILSNLFTISKLTSTLIYSFTNSIGWSYTQSFITTNKTHALIAQPIVCAANSSGGTTTNSAGSYRGIGKVQFVKTSFDSLIGQFYRPITNSYSLTLIFGSLPVKQTYQRVITTPDMLLTAADLLPGSSAVNNGNPRTARSMTFDISTIAQNLAGPGVIETPQVFTFNKVGPVLDNASTAFLNQATAIQLYQWGSFDGSTNAPTIYPNGTSIDNLNNLITVSITPPAPFLPSGKTGVAYTAITFNATGGAFSQPFIWSLPAISSLPPGLTLSPGGTLSGTPTRAGTYDFTILRTDSLARTVTWSYSITVTN